MPTAASLADAIKTKFNVTSELIEGGGGVFDVHADGTQSTTQMAWRSDLGRETAVSVVARPVEAAPMKSAAEEAQERLRVDPGRAKR